MNQSIALISALTISLFSIGCASEFETVCNEDSKAQKCRGDDGCSGLQVCSGGYWLACECSGGVDSSEMLSSSEENPENPISSSDKEGTGGSSNTVNGGVNSDATGGTGGTGGTDNSGGTGECIPKTCDTLTVILSGDAIQQGEPGSSCGTHEDGCGNFIFCDECNGDNRECGGLRNIRITNPIPEPYVQGEAGVCGGGCLQQTNNTVEAYYCSGYAEAYTCPVATNGPIPAELDGKECEYSEWDFRFICCN